MKKYLPWLAAALILQAVVAVALLWHNGQTAEADSTTLLAAEASPDTIIVVGSDTNTRLELQGQKWVLPDLHGLPASPNKVSTVLDKLRAVTSGWPVTTTKASHQRFEVSETNFQRRIKLEQSGKGLADFYLGTSPGLRKVHLRHKEADAVYSVALATYDFPLQAEDWLDKTLLQAPGAQKMSGGDFTLINNGDSWAFKSPEGASADSNKAAALARAFTTLHVLGLSEPPASDPTVKLTVEDGNESWEFSLWQEEDEYLIQRSDIAHTFTLSQHTFDRLSEANAQSLTAAEASANPAPQETEIPSGETPRDEAPST